jgi:hypothetical protein
MNDEATRYNGWTNYETWCVHLWLTNEEGTYRYWRDEARRHRKEAPSNHSVEGGILSIEQLARCKLAEQLKSELEEASPLEEASMFSDLLTAALSEVDWHEVADAFLDDLEPEESGADQSDDDDEEPKGEDAEAFEQEKRERIENPRGPLFDLGRVVSTPGALEALTRKDIAKAVGRHHRGDWGDVGREDWQRNERALYDGSRLSSVYHAGNGTKFWVITEADRSATTVLLPNDY